METLSELELKRSDYNPFKLYIPEEFLPDLLSLVEQLNLQIQQVETKRDTALRLYNRTFNIQEQSIKDALNHCLDKTQQAAPKTLFDFVSILVEEVIITLKPNPESNINADFIRAKLQTFINTALIQSLFIQFAHEDDLLKCTTQLVQLVHNPALINWKIIDTSDFKIRLQKQGWSVFCPLLIDKNDECFNTTMLTSIGLNEQDVILAYFANQESTLHWKLQNIPNNPIIMDLIGEIIWEGEHYFLTNPGFKNHPYQCLVISKYYPHDSSSYIANEASWAQIKVGTFFVDTKSLVQDLADFALKGTTPIELTNMYLRIPEAFRPKIFQLFYEVYLEVHGDENQEVKKRDILKQLVTQSGSDFFGTQAATQSDISSEWERSLNKIESKKFLHILDFRKHLSEKTNKSFQFQLLGFSTESKKMRALDCAIGNALIQNLFDNFVNEPNVYKCAQHLSRALQGLSFSKDIDMKGFDKRLKEQWSAIRPLTYRHFNEKYSFRLSHSLLSCFDINVNTFTQAFFSKRPIKKIPNFVQNRKYDSKEPGLLNDIIPDVVSYLKEGALCAFRITCKYNYNVSEEEDVSRINHRLYLISQSVLLQEFIGKKICFNQGYLLSNVGDNKSYVTHMQEPYPIIFICCGNQGQWDKTIGGHVFKDKKDKLTILTAYRSEIHDSTFAIQRLQKDTFTDCEKFQHLKKVTVQHPARSVKNNFNAPTWDREAVICLNQDEVVVDVTFKQLPQKNYFNQYFLSANSTTERYQATFNLDAFDDADAKVIQAKLI